jgi:hypothetical protein
MYELISGQFPEKAAGGHAEPGRDPAGWLVGSTPVHPMLKVNFEDLRAYIRGCKWSIHDAGDERPRGVSPDELVRFTMLLTGGPWYMKLFTTEPPSQECEVTLNAPGDYLCWEQPAIQHTWEALGNATLLTVDFRRINAR